jgi:hypothetical protein
MTAAREGAYYTDVYGLGARRRQTRADGPDP